MKDTLESTAIPADRDIRDEHVHVIEPRGGWRLLDFRELWRNRELLWVLTLRDIKVKYAQSALGVSWAIIQPVMFMLVFNVVFGNMAGIDSDGQPYAVFSFAALVPWTFFSQALIDSTNSLVSNANMMTKIYFPRIIMPMAAVAGKLVDFCISFLILIGLMVWFKSTPTVWVVLLPGLVLLMILTALGLGTWLAALAVQYRDVKYGMTFLVQILMFAAPVVYPMSMVPEPFRAPYALNPMVGVIEGFRATLLGATAMPWLEIGIGTASALAIGIGGAMYFRRMERIFADVA